MPRASVGFCLSAAIVTAAAAAHAQAADGVTGQTRPAISAGGSARWDYNLEPMLQWGNFGTGLIRAWGVATDLGYTWRHVPLTPRLAAIVTVRYFRAGAFLRQTPPGDDVLYTTTFITCRF